MDIFMFDTRILFDKEILIVLDVTRCVICEPFMRVGAHAGKWDRISEQRLSCEPERVTYRW